MKSLLLIFIFFSFSCQERTKAEPSDAQSEINASPNAKTFNIGTVKISATRSAYNTPQAPKPKALQSCILEKLKQSPYFANDKGNKVDINITYDILEEKSTSLVLLAEMQESGDDGRMISAGTRTQSNGQGFEKMGEEACSDLVTRLTNNVRVATSSSSELIAILSEPDNPPGILKNAIHSIREQNVTSASPKLVPLLEHEDTNVAIAAAANLAKFQYSEGRPGVLALGEKLSRNKNPAYLPMIYILADIGGAEINEYLKIVSTSHEIPRIREVATKALAKAKEKKSLEK